MAKMKLHNGFPIGDPWAAFYAALGDDTTPIATSTEITLTTEGGNRLVFKGTFTVVAGEVTAGTMTSFETFAGATKVFSGSDFSIDGAALFDAIEVFETDDGQAFHELLYAPPIEFKGSKLDDYIEGGAADDTLLGRKGNDSLYGLGGSNVLKGGDGNDFLSGGEGNNTLWGDAGNDTFHLFASTKSTSFSRIKDFGDGKDLIGLSARGAELQPGYLDSAQFHKGKAATSADQRIIYDKKSGDIYFDPDGTDVTSQVRIGKVDPGTKLSAGDFYVQDFLV